MLAARIRVGTGWSGMTLVGRGDYTGDGTRYAAGAGFNGYTALAAAGDTDGDGKADLIASDAAGALWPFKGTGKTAAPFAARVQIGTAPGSRRSPSTASPGTWGTRPSRWIRHRSRARGSGAG